MTFDSKFVNGALLQTVTWDPNEVLCYHFNLWDWETDVHEGFKGDGEVVAFRLWTSYSALKLPMHQVHDY